MATMAGATLRGVRNQTYFGVWKHFQTVEGLDQPEDSLTWRVRVTEPGVYRVSLRYASGDVAGREGIVEANGQTVPFQVLRTAELRRENPPPVYEHQIGQIRFDRAGEQTITLRPRDAGTNLMLLESVVLNPMY
jgi:alpha-L-fucosidase